MSDTNNGTYLKELGNSNFEIAEGEFDIRGWMVKNDRGKILGKVNDLIFDTKAQKVKYLILDTDSNELFLQNRKVMLPLEHASFDEVYRNVIYPGSMANELSAVPTYEKGKISSKIEELIQNAFVPAANARSTAYDTSFASSGSQLHQPTSSHHQFSNQINQTSAEASKSDVAKGQAAIGVFEYTSEAQAAVAYLTDSGFNRNDIEISYRDREDIERGDIREKEGISGFFSRLFSSEESEWLHSDEGKRYTVVAVSKLSLAEAERAAEIMDRHGAINIDERFKRYRESAQNTDKEQKTYRSRIIDNPGGNDNVRWR